MSFWQYFVGLFIYNARRLIKNPLVFFVYGIFSKWYIMVSVTAIVVVYGVFSNLEGAGYIESTEKLIYTKLNEIKSVAVNCTSLIDNRESFFRCVSNPPPYQPIEGEKELMEQLEKTLPQTLIPPEPGAPLGDDLPEEEPEPYL